MRIGIKMDKKQLLLILNRVLELYEADYDNLPFAKEFHTQIEKDKYIKEQGFTFEKLSEEINAL